jgi:KaiC/GvpD/RAD55 family RecA-like ATPase
LEKASKAELIEKLIGSETKAELLMFFHENPETIDALDGIAKRLHRSPKDIEHDLSDLVDLGLLHEVRTFSFDKARDLELQREISKRLISPSASEETDKASSKEKTGVAIIDELLPEGYPSSSVVLVMGDPATGKTTLMVQLVAEALRSGKNIVYATLDDFPDSVRSSMRVIGIDPARYETEARRKLTFIDCYSFLVGVRSREQYSEDPQRLSDLSIVVSKALSETSDPSNTLLAMDSLTTLLQRSGVRPSFDFLHTLVAKIRSCKASCVTSLSRKAFHPAIIAAIQDKVDGVIEMKAEDTKEGFARYIRVSKMRSARHVTAWTPYNRDPNLGLIIPSRAAVS